MSRETTEVELPPQPPLDLRRWAEETIDYLHRTNTRLQNQIDELEARIETLEALHP